MYMHGSLEQLKQFVDQRLTDVPLNELEIGLLNKFMQNPEENALRIADNLRKSAVRLSKVCGIFEVLFHVRLLV